MDFLSLRMIDLRNPTDSGRARIVIEYYLPTPTASEAAMQACHGILTADFDFCGHALNGSTGGKHPYNVDIGGIQTQPKVPLSKNGNALRTIHGHLSS